MQLKEKEQELKLNDLKCKELRKQLPNNKLKPLTRNDYRKAKGAQDNRSLDKHSNIYMTSLPNETEISIHEEYKHRGRKFSRQPMQNPKMANEYYSQVKPKQRGGSRESNRSLSREDYAVGEGIVSRNQMTNCRSMTQKKAATLKVIQPSKLDNEGYSSDNMDLSPFPDVPDIGNQVFTTPRDNNMRQQRLLNPKKDVAFGRNV